jgi:hypothetical protein
MCIMPYMLLRFDLNLYKFPFLADAKFNNGWILDIFPH